MEKEGMSIWGNARVRSFAIKIAAGSQVDISGILFVFKTIINRIKHTYHLIVRNPNEIS
jgi:hypothetical protein